MATLTKEYLDQKFEIFGKEILTQVGRKLDTFAEMIAREFFAIHEKIDKLEIRLDKIESRLDQIESRLDKVESRLDSHDAHFALMELELKDIKLKIDYYAKQNREDTDVLAKDILKLQKRVSILESKYEKLKNKSQHSIKVK